MLDTPVKTVLSTIHAHAWRLSLHTKMQENNKTMIDVSQPDNNQVKLTPVDVETALTDSKNDMMTIIWMPPGVNAPSGIDHTAETWLQEDANAPDVIALRRGLVRAGTRSIRVFWSDHRVLVYTNAEHLADALDAIVRFTQVEHETIDLEQTMKRVWSSLQSDIDLTGKAKIAPPTDQSHIRVQGALTTRMKLSHLKLSHRLEQTDQTLTEGSRRLFSELTLAAAIYDRIGELDDPIQFALEHYELANTRLLEAQNAAAERSEARTGQILELAIIGLLIYPLHLFW